MIQAQNLVSNLLFPHRLSMRIVLMSMSLWVNFSLIKDYYLNRKKKKEKKV